MKYRNFLIGYKLRKFICCYLLEVKVGKLISCFYIVYIYYKFLYVMQWIYDELDIVYWMNVFYIFEFVMQLIIGLEQVLLFDDLYFIFELL